MTDEPQRLTDGREVLLRQVHPSQVDAVFGLTKAVFLPKPDEEMMVSVLRGYVDPAEAHRRHTVDKKLDSAGTWGVSVSEGDAEGVPSWDDACLPVNPVDHASLDFTQHPATNQRKRVAKRLRDAAVERGCLFAADAVQSSQAS